MPKNSPPVISNVQISPTSGPGGTVFSALVTASEFPPLKISYQWKLDGADIIGATGAGLIASAAGQLTVLATATNDFGSDSRESAAVLVSAALAAPVVTEARIEPAAGVVGDRFAVIAEATGVPAPELSYQWMRDGVSICGATATTHDATEPGDLTVRVSARNTEGTGSRDSAVVRLASVQAAPTVITVEILPSGGLIGDVFTAVADVIGSPAPALSYQWLIDGNVISGATGASHAPATAGLLAVRVTATNAAGSDARVAAGVPVSSASVAPRVESASIQPSSGRVGDTFTATATVSGNPVPALSYQWLIDGNAIAGATGASHAPATAGLLAVRITATNAAGSDTRVAAGVPITSASVAPRVESASIQPSAGRVGDTFTAMATVSGNPAPVLRFEWLLGGQVIAAATGATYTATNAGALQVRIFATNSAGEANRDSSAVPIEPALVAPVISGATIAPQSGVVGTTFGVTVAASGNPAPQLSYQWLMNGDAIEGATGASYVASTAGPLSVRVTATNAAGSATVVPSASVLPAIGAPVAAAGSHNWTEDERTGVRTFDAAALFSVPGDPTKATVSYGLMAGGGASGPFVAGVLEDGVFVALEDGYVSIDPARGVVSVDTGESGVLDDVAITVRATNGAGHDDLTITLRVGQPAAAVTWNPGDKHASAALSDGDRVVSNPMANSFGARASRFVSAGRFYFEVEAGLAVLHGAGSHAGIATSTPTITASLPPINGSASGGVTCRVNGTVFRNGADLGAGPGGWAAPGSVLCVAVDMNAGKAYFRVNGGSWTGDPAAGTGGYDVSGSSVAAIGVPRRNTGETNPGSLRLRSLASEFAYAPPAGFTPYAQVQA
jgi:PKD repeat protein